MKTQRKRRKFFPRITLLPISNFFLFCFEKIFPNKKKDSRRNRIRRKKTNADRVMLRCLSRTILFCFCPLFFFLLFFHTNCSSLIERNRSIGIDFWNAIFITLKRDWFGSKSELNRTKSSSFIQSVFFSLLLKQSLDHLIYLTNGRLYRCNESE